MCKLLPTSLNGGGGVLTVSLLVTTVVECTNSNQNVTFQGIVMRDSLLLSHEGWMDEQLAWMNTYLST